MVDLFNNGDLVHHNNQNNKQSEEQLCDNLAHFTKQALLVFSTLLIYKRISTKSAMMELNIQDVRPRIKSLLDAGVHISEEVIEGQHGRKEWFMTVEQMVYNREHFSYLFTKKNT